MSTFILNNEKELLKQAAEGDEAAFTRLFYAYHNKLGAYITHLTKSREIAEEIVQDVFIKIWTSREKLTNIDAFGSYLYVLSKNHTLNCLRKLAKERVHKQQIAERLKQTSKVNNFITPSPDYYVLLDQAVAQLPPQQQRAYILSRRKRLKYDEIARQMNISKETVKKYLQLATRSIIGYARAHEELLVWTLAFGCWMFV